MKEEYRLLHVGGEGRYQGWENFNIVPGDAVDHVGDTLDLSRFEDKTFKIVYASHVLEHFDHVREVDIVLGEWFRVLAPGGKLCIGVPDLDVLFPLLLRPDFRYRDRYAIMQIIYGGHSNPYDYHKIGWNIDMLSHYLTQTGFAKISRVASFGIFNDTTNMTFEGLNISLNVVAEKPVAAK